MGKKNLVFLVMFVVVASGVIFGVAYTSSTKAEQASCTKLGPTHAITIQNGEISPSDVTGKLCDRLQITNRDNETREIGFGEHDHHTAYDGITERVLRKDESFTLTMSRAGEFHYHDHFHDETAGTFTVR